MAAIFAWVVWLVGFGGALVLKDVGQPTRSTLVVTQVGALIFAGLTLILDVMNSIDGVVRAPAVVYPLAGAVIEYAIKL